MPKYRVTLHDVFRVAFAADVDVEADTREEAEKKALDMAHRGKVEFGDVEEWMDWDETQVIDADEVDDAEVPGDVAGEA